MMRRLIELLRDAFTTCPMSRSQAWAEIWRQRAASLAEGEPRAAKEGCESTGDDPSANSKLTWSTEDAD